MPCIACRPHWSIILHHLSCVATLCLLTFTIFDTGALQPMLFVAHTFLLFETLEVGGCIFASQTVLMRVCVVGPTRAVCGRIVLLQALNIYNAAAFHGFHRCWRRATAGNQPSLIHKAVMYWVLLCVHGWRTAMAGTASAQVLCVWPKR